jgi:flagellar motor protein MotB
VNHELTELLVYLEDPQVLPKIRSLIENSETTEDLSQYLVYSRYLKDGWDLESKRTFLKGVQRLESFPGGKFHQKIVNFLREEMMAKLTDPEKVALAKWTEPFVPEKEDEVTEAPVFVKAWTVEDFNAHFGKPLHGRDFEKGRIAYGKSSCTLCHKMTGNRATMKGVLGPDLTNVGGRFGLRDLLVSIIHPSRAINDKYRNPAAPNLSGMPPGLINVLTEEEVLDLLAYLQSGGRKNDPVYSEAPPKVSSGTNRDPIASAVITNNDPLLVPQDDLVNGIKIPPTFFTRGSAVNQGDRDRLFNDMNRVLKFHPDVTFKLIGHADDSKYKETNFDISSNRAKFTALNMIYRGIPKSAVSYEGVGDTEPSTEGNRRVEVIVTLNKKN